MTGKTIQLVFKTHLDIGFTDHAEKVRVQYHDRFIPQAIDTGEHFFAEDPKNPKFIWTTGAWLIWDHLNSQSKAKVKRLERAIERGLIVWHALPFTTHSELLSPALFKAGMSYASELDKRFGKKTIAAKMTDVPGHTLAIVPLLAAAGVKFLHIGVNTASPAPDVPGVFRWRAPSGEEIIVMYQTSYGATHFPDNFTDGLSFAHTSDNMGPQSVSQTAQVYREMTRAYPDTEIRAATLDSYAELIWARRAEFPVVDLELGDSWIHGAASDPLKLQKFVALQRLFDALSVENLTKRRLEFGRRLAMVAEHTWGVDIKSFLRDEIAWDRPAFEKARKSDYRFAYSEASWHEQRALINTAVAALDPDDKKHARKALLAIKPPRQTPGKPGVTGPSVELAGWWIDLDPATGDIASVTTPEGTEIRGRKGALFGFRYQSFNATDMARHLDTYLTHREPWALLDHDKPGLASARTATSATWVPRLIGATKTAGSTLLHLEMPERTHEQLGAPRHLELHFAALAENRLQINLVLRDKPANRMPEAGFFGFTPAGGTKWDYCKMGLWQPGDRVARRGGGHLQAVSAVRTQLSGKMVQFSPLDTPLVAPQNGDFMAFSKTPPDLSQGLRFNLFNNKWGTNFPMWWEGDFLARFVLDAGETTAD